MNLQILKLAQKSGATVNQGFDGTKNFVYGITMSPEELDKFAQLIVKECSDLFEIEWSEEKLTGNDVGYVLKKHFGVEE